MDNPIFKITLYQGVLYVYMNSMHRIQYEPDTLEFISEQEGAPYKSVKGINWQTIKWVSSVEPGKVVSRSTDSISIAIPTKQEVANFLLEHQPARAASLDLVEIFGSLKPLLMHPNKAVRIAAMKQAGKNASKKKQENQQQEQDEQNQSR